MFIRLSQIISITSPNWLDLYFRSNVDDHLYSQHVHGSHTAFVANQSWACKSGNLPDPFVSGVMIGQSGRPSDLSWSCARKLMSTMASGLSSEFSKFSRKAKQLKQILLDTKRCFQEINTAGKFESGKWWNTLCQCLVSDWEMFLYLSGGGLRSVLWFNVGWSNPISRSSVINTGSLIYHREYQNYTEPEH